MTTLLAHLVLLAWVSQATAGRFVRNGIDRLLAAAMLFWGNIVVLSLLLSCLGKLGEANWFFRGSLLLGLLTLGLVRFFTGRQPAGEPEPPSPRDEKRSRLLIAAVFGTLGLIFLANLRIAWSYPPNNYDSLAYHLPRVMYYLGHGTLTHFETADIRQVYFPFNYNLLQLFCLIYSAPIESLDFLNLAAWVLSGLAIYRISRFCGCSFNSSLVATWLTITATEVLAQSTTTTLDLSTAAALLTTIVFVLRWRIAGRASDALVAGTAAGLAAGAKLTVVFFGPAAVLLLAVLGYRAWRQKEAPQFFGGVRAWLLPTLVVIALTVPFIIFNLAATGHWMTNKLDFTLNKPFTFGCAFQTAKTYLFQLFAEPLGRFSFNLEWIRYLNEWFARVVFKNWNEAYAYSALYVIPPDLNEDHVWYGFAGPLILVCAIVCFWRDRSLRGPLSWMALLGLGWFATYFAMNKWSLYIQRYFLPAIMIMGPCLAAVLDGEKNRSRALAAAKQFVFCAVAATSLWFSVVYLLHNHNRPFSLPFTKFNAPQVLPDLPPGLLERLPAQSRVNVITDGTNERIYLLMTLGQKQRFTSSQQVDPTSYNLFSYWGFTRNNIYSNIAHIASYTTVHIPTKQTAGVEFLGTVGDGVNAFDYLGLAPHAADTKARPENSNISVLIYYAPGDPDRFAHSLIRIEGLSARDGARVKISAEMTDGTHQLLVSETHSGETKISIKQPFKRLQIQVSDILSGRNIGYGELPFTTKPTDGDIPVPLSPTTLFRTELISPGAIRNLSVNGLADLEGPYSQWDLPLFRWAKQPVVRIEIPANAKLKRLRLSFNVRLQVREEAHLVLLHNDKPVRDFWLHGHAEWRKEAVDLIPANGENVLELRDSPNSNVPDWLAYLEQNPDVKDYLVAHGVPLESGAREHYELKGRAEGRKLPMHENPVPAAPPPDSLYFIYNSLQVEGFTDR